MVLAQPEAFVTILIATVLISLISTLAYKYTTDQAKMKRIKEKLKELQKQMRDARGDQDRMLKINAQIMKNHNEYSMASMRSLIFTIVPVMIIFIYLQGHVAYTPIGPGEEFSLLLDYRDETRIGEVAIGLPASMELVNRTPYDRRGFLGFNSMNGERVTIQGPPEEGVYEVEFTDANATVNRSVLITQGREYLPPLVSFRDHALKSAAIEYRGLRVLDISWLPGWLQGWLAVYILLTLILTNILRKLLKVH